MKYSKAIDRIYNNLMSGEVYGHVSFYRRDYPDKQLAGKEYFSANVYKHYCKPFICWTHYGSSANKATKEGLSFVIHKIFGMNALQFEKKYITRTAFQEKYGREI